MQSEIIFSFIADCNYIEILIKDKHCLYMEYKTMNNVDDNMKALQGIYERNLS